MRSLLPTLAAAAALVAFGCTTEDDPGQTPAQPPADEQQQKQTQQPEVPVIGMRPGTGGAADAAGRMKLTYFTQGVA